jgi:hypothetical protein
LFQGTRHLPTDVKPGPDLYLGRATPLRIDAWTVDRGEAARDPDAARCSGESLRTNNAPERGIVDDTLLRAHLMTTERNGA